MFIFVNFQNVPVMLPIHAYQSTMLENAREKRMEPDGMELDI
jgi:hypothetical protein